MADSSRKENFEVQPAVQCKSANKKLAVKNARVSERWQRVRNSLESEKREFANKVKVDRTVLLKQRERLQATSTITKIGLESSSNQPRESMTAPRMTLADVYDALIKTVKEQSKPGQGEDLTSVQSEPHRRRASTLSFDNKRITRRPTYFSLQDLQRAQTTLNTKLQAIAQEQELNDDDETDNETASEKGPFDLNEEEKALGPKLRLPPTCLPPIRTQNLFQPRARNFEKRRFNSCPDSSDMEYCRYLRTGRRNSTPDVRPRMTLRYSTMNLEHP